MTAKKTVYALFENEGNHHIFYDRDSRKDGYAIPFVNLREAVEAAGYNFKPTFDYKGLGSYTDVACIISFNLLNQPIFDSIRKHPKEKCFFLLLEPPTTNGTFYDPQLTHYFGRIFTMMEDMVDNKRYFKFIHPQCCEKFVENVPDFKDKKFAVMVQSNHYVPHPKSMYEERRKIATYFPSKGEFDLYGPNWNGFAAWRGEFKTGKMDLIKNYKFSLSFENMYDQTGYLTERLMENFFAKTVPVYLGPKNIEKFVPKECYIKPFDFPSHEALYQHLQQMNRDTYQSYLDAAQKFINSPLFAPFSTKAFAETMMKNIKEIENI